MVGVLSIEIFGNRCRSEFEASVLEQSTEAMAWLGTEGRILISPSGFKPAIDREQLVVACLEHLSLVFECVLMAQ
jgi:hypothetical protein